MLYRIHIFHSKQLTSMFCHFPEIYGPEGSASSEICFQVPPTDPRGLHRVSILRPAGVQWVISACVTASSAFDLIGETSPDTKALCGMSAKPGPMERRRHTWNRTCIYPKGSPQFLGWGDCEFLNSSLPPWRSCTARCWDKGGLGFPHLLQEAGEAAAVAPQGSDDSDHLAARVIRDPDGERPDGRAQLAVKAAVLFHRKVNSLSQGVFYLVFAGGLCAKYG